MEDCGVVEIGELIALRCPVTQRRLTQPCRTVHCLHAACFCTTSVPHLRVLADGTRQCPICPARFVSESELIVDANATLFLAQQPASQSAAVSRVGGSFLYSVARRPMPKPRAPAAGRAAVPSRAAETGESSPAPGASSGRTSDMVRLMVRFVPASTAAGDDAAGRAHGAPAAAAAARLLAADASDAYAALVPSEGAGAPGHPRAWRCEVCGETCVGDRAAHDRTISHLFARTVAATGGAPTQHLAIPSGNVGYRMLRDRLGWEEGRGLGKHSEGALQPVPTRLKRDRRGLRVLPTRDSEEEEEEAAARGGSGSQAGGGARRAAAVEPLRVTHPSSAVMGPGCDVRAETKAERRARRRQEERRRAYLKRCRELIVDRQMHGVY